MISKFYIISFILNLYCRVIYHQWQTVNLKGSSKTFMKHFCVFLNTISLHASDDASIDYIHNTGNFSTNALSPYLSLLWIKGVAFNIPCFIK